MFFIFSTFYVYFNQLSHYNQLTFLHNNVIITKVLIQYYFSNEREVIHMLIRNCVSNLFRSNDENVRVTIFNKNPKYYITGGYMHSFLETVRNSLGPGITSNSAEELCFFLIFEVADNYIYKEIDCYGKQIMDEIEKLIEYPKSIRIECCKRGQFRSKRSWLILVL